MSLLFETPRLRIETIHLKEDCVSLLTIHNHITTMRWIPNNKMNWTLTDLEYKYKLNQQLYPQHIGIYKIVFKVNDQQIVIGEVGLFPCIDSHTTLEIGYILFESYWKMGLATELLDHTINFIQNNLPFTSIKAQLFEANIPSRKLLERCSFIYTTSVLLEENQSKLIYHKQLVPKNKY